MPKLLTKGSPWQQFKQQWQDCCRCRYCATRKNIVLARGSVPCDVLFIGEAPGASEDAIGQPFIGPAGKLLDRLIEEALENAYGDPELRPPIAFTNLVCCIPKEGMQKIGEPEEASIEACEDRLNAFVELCQPKLIVHVGDLAEKFGPEIENTVQITHPAAILRAELVRQDLMCTKVIVILENAFREL